MLPLLVRVDDLATGASKQYAFTHSPVRVGRNPMNDITLDAGFISQWHGLIRFDANTTEYIDLGSTNGTLANGVRMEKNVPMPVDGNVELRVTSLRFYCWRAPAQADLAAEMSRYSIGPAAQSMLDAGGRSRGPAQAQAAAVQRFPEAMSAVQQLMPLYQAYRQAWAQLVAGIRRVLQGMPGPLQQAALLLVQKQMPDVVGEEEFRKLAEERGVELLGQAGLWAGATRMVAEFAKALVPGVPVQSVGDVEKLLVRAATMLETSARAFVELLKGHAEFSQEMAVRTAGEMTPLHRAREPRDVLRYLLDPQSEVTSRIQEMTSAYADVMVHQVALLNGMMEGVRGLLKRLGPAYLEHELRSRGGLSFWPFKNGALWRLFVDRHREYSEEERQLSAAVFGKEFARAYSAVVGEEVQDPGSARHLAGKTA